MNTPVTYFSQVPTGRRAVDLAVLAALFVLALLGFDTVYGGPQYLVTGLMALVLGVLIALLAARFRWGPLRIAPLVIGMYLLLGSTFAAPTRALWGVVPTPGSLWELIKAPVTSWKSVLTMAPPVGTTQGVLVVVWISVLLLSLLSATIVLRTRRYVAAWLFPLALLLVGFLFGTTEAVLPVVRGVLFGVLSLGWLTWRHESDRLAGSRSTIISDTVRPSSWQNPVLRRRVVGGTLIVALSAGAAIGAQSLLDPPSGTQRFALRDTMTPPFDPREYVSPLTEFRGYLKNQRESELFTATGMSGGEYIRLATMDQYDLQVYNVAGGRDPRAATGAFLRTASGVDLHEGTGAQRSTTITIGEYSGVWMPTAGSRTDRIDVGEGETSTALSENLYLNQQSQTAVDTTGLGAGESYTLLYEPYTAPTAEQTRTATFSELELPENSRLEGDFEQLAEEWAGDNESDYERFQNLSRAIKDDGFFSHGIEEDDAASLSGHGASRLWAMLQDTGFDEESAEAQPLGRIGDQEQYAALTAVMARSIGMPARVVMGFEVPEGQEGTVTVTGDDVTAWVEVSFEGLGWVRFDPAPDEDDTPVEDVPTEVEKPLPQVAQPPPPPAEPPSPPPGALSEDADDPPEPLETRSWVVYVLAALLPLLLLGLVLGGIVVAKTVRRNRRRSLTSAAARADGGWQEILDLLSDLGRRPDPIRTRAETAALMDAEVPGLGAALLARRADRVVFGPDDLPPLALDEYWSQVLDTRRGMTAAVPWHRRLRALFSLRSFRRPAAERGAERRRARLNTRRRLRASRLAESVRRRRTRSGGSTTSRKGSSR